MCPAIGGRLRDRHGVILTTDMVPVAFVAIDTDNYYYKASERYFFEEITTI